MGKEIIRSPLKYQGSKLKLVPWIQEVAKFNPYEEVWLEPFLGSGVVALNMNAKRAFVSDINTHVLDLFRMMKDNSYFIDGMKATMKTHHEMLNRYGEEYYYQMRVNFNDNHHPNNLLFLNHTCFNGVMRFNQKGNYNVPFGKNINKLNVSYVEQLVGKLEKARDASANWNILNWDYKQMFDIGYEDSVIYLDPPYIDRESGYYGTWTDTNERELHELVMNTDARVVLSTWYQANGKTNEYVKSLWGDLNLHTKDHRYSVGQKKENRYPVVEALLTNF